jgi:hypothetical protein
MSKIPRLLPLIAVAIGGVVLVRAVGVAPGVFEGAQAWAEEAVPAGAAAAPAARPKDKKKAAPTWSSGGAKVGQKARGSDNKYQGE